MTNVNNLHWAVIYECQASEFEKEHEEVVAVFVTLVDAEDYIYMATPGTTRGRFYIKHI